MMSGMKAFVPFLLALLFPVSASSQVGGIEAITPPLLAVVAQSPTYSIPGMPVPFDVVYFNRSLTRATGVTITIEAPTRITTAPAVCSVDGPRAICSIGDVGYGRFAGPRIGIEAPLQSDTQFRVTLTISATNAATSTASDASRTYRTAWVENTADSGGGSLRAAVEWANAACRDGRLCAIAFRIPPAASRWRSIRLESPLPRIVASRVVIDGTTQTYFFGDSNPAGPEVEVTGAALTEGNGFELPSLCYNVLRGLTINGFPGNGVLVLPLSEASPEVLQCIQFSPSVRVEQNYIGTDATGNASVPNQRGIWTETRNRVYVYDNVISGNARSGVYVQRGYVDVERNRIGLNAGVTAALGNGASGVYVGPEATARIRDNYIGFNEHFGVAVSPQAMNVSAGHNSFQANWQMAIDWGFDGLITRDPAPLPEITSVHFENGVTTIDVMVAALAGFPPAEIDLYANDVPDPSGYGEGQYLLGSGQADRATGRLVFNHPGDLRGKWVTAAATFDKGYIYYPPPLALRIEAQALPPQSTVVTSEFSRAVEVK